MKTFKNWILGRKAANQTLNFMDVKELSERMEMAEIQAKNAVMIYERAKLDYEAACDQYMDQCKNHVAWKRYAS